MRELLAEVGDNGSEYVFPGKDGRSRMIDMNKQVNAIKAAAGLPKDFRPLHGFLLRIFLIFCATKTFAAHLCQSKKKTALLLSRHEAYQAIREPYFTRVMTSK